MKYLKNLKKESRDLEVFEAERLLKGFLADKGIKADIQKFDQYFNIFISSYANEEGPKRVPVKKLLDYFKSLEISEDAQISKTKFGYTIEMISDAGDAKLMEASTDADDVVGKCAICENFYHGLGHDPWPVFTKPEERCCNECKKEFVMPARRELLNERTKNEASEKADIEHAASNVVLDDKFIWLFNVLDSNGEDIEEGIEYLQNAIDTLIDNQGTFLVGFPYVDPKPGDKSVELVFADNPGPVVIYNKEESTVAKGKLEKPTSKKQPKRKEATKKEAEDTNRFTVSKYGRWWWTILDTKNNLYVRKEENKDKLLLFKQKDQAQDWCDKHNSKYEEATKTEANGSPMRRDVYTIADAAYAAYDADVIENEEYREVELSRDRLINFIDSAEIKMYESTDVKTEGLVSNEQTDAITSVNLLYNYVTKRDSIIEEIYGKKGLNKITDYLRQLSQVVNRIGRLSDKLSDKGNDIDSLPWQEASERTEEQKQIIDEAKEDIYYIAIDFTKEWYADYTPEDTVEVSEILDAFVQGLEDDLENVYDIYLSFEYYGGAQEDYFSTPLTLEQAELAKEALEGEYLDVYIRKHDIFQGNGDDK